MNSTMETHLHLSTGINRSVFLIGTRRCWFVQSIRPYTMDPHGLEEAYWRYFDGKQEDIEVLELEREEAETKLADAGFS